MWIYRQWKTCGQFSLLIWTIFIGHFVIQQEGRGWGKEGKELVQPATRFTLWKNMEIWCKIQVIINLLIYLEQLRNKDIYHQKRFNNNKDDNIHKREALKQEDKRALTLVQNQNRKSWLLMC